MKIKRKDIIEYMGKEYLEQDRPIIKYTNRELLKEFIQDIIIDKEHALREIKVV